MTETERVRVMIVDDHLMVRRGLATFLRAAPDLELVGELRLAPKLVRMCADLRPHVVLMDLRMPELHGIAATRAILEAHPEIQMIAVTSSHEDELASGALRAGAIGLLAERRSASASYPGRR